MRKEDSIAMDEIWYVIDGGNLFIGTMEQFCDCFGGVSCARQIEDWCKKNGYSFVAEKAEIARLRLPITGR